MASNRPPVGSLGMGATIIGRIPSNLDSGSWRATMLCYIVTSREKEEDRTGGAE